MSQGCARKQGGLLQAPFRLSIQASGAVERTILGVIGLLMRTVENEMIASRQGFLQGCDPRFKLLSILLLLVSALASHSVVTLAVLWGACLVLALASAVPFHFFLQRTLIFIPIFSLFIVAPAVFSVVTPGTVVLSFRVLAQPLSITQQGIDSAVLLLMRVLTSVSLAVLLTLTTRQYVLLKTIRIFRVPPIFVMTIGMCYRYIYLFLDLMYNSFIAVRSRIGFSVSAQTGRRIVTANMASLWLRSYRMHNQIFDAMQSRGYDGEPRVLDEFRGRPRDYLLVGCSFSILIGAIWLNRYFR